MEEMGDEELDLTAEECAVLSYFLREAHGAQDKLALKAATSEAEFDAVLRRMAARQDFRWGGEWVTEGEMRLLSALRIVCGVKEWLAEHRQSESTAHPWA